MDFVFLFRIAMGVLFTWTGIGCLVGVVRFRFPPLIVLGAGYLLWVVTFVSMPTGAAAQSPHAGVRFLLALVCLIMGAICIFTFRFTRYKRMKAQGITPRRLFGFGASK